MIRLGAYHGLYGMHKPHGDPLICSASLSRNRREVAAGEERQVLLGWAWTGVPLSVHGYQWLLYSNGSLHCLRPGLALDGYHWEHVSTFQPTVCLRSRLTVSSGVS